MCRYSSKFVMGLVVPLLHCISVNKENIIYLFVCLFITLNVLKVS